MTLEQLRVFVAVAQCLHVTRAAETLHMTQSAASASIATLESRHDVKLFDRVGRTIELTQAGRTFLPVARELLARAGDAQAMLSELATEPRGELVVLASQTVINHWLPAHLPDWHRRYRQVRLRVGASNTSDAIAAVLRGDADAAVVEGRVDDPDLVISTLGGDRLVLVTPPGHPWAKRSRLDATAYRAATWVIREAGSGTRLDLETALSAAGVDSDALDVALELPSNESVLAAVSAGLGVSAVSALAAARHPELVCRTPDWPTRRFSLIVHRERVPGRALQALIGALQASAETKQQD